jgi:plastocyanin
MTRFASLLLPLALGLGIAACSSGGSNSSAPTAPDPGTPDSPSATITLTSSGVAPKTVTISAGGQVTFINNDSRTHNMQSDPHPEHTDCPELAQVGFLTPGQSRTSGNLNTVRTCGYHDHDDFSNTRFWGNIVIQ